MNYILRCTIIYSYRKIHNVIVCIHAMWHGLATIDDELATGTETD